MKLFKIIAVLLCPMLLCSCATIISGKSQNISINTTPDEATITINGISQTSPCVFVLDRSVAAYYVKIEKQGYKPVTITLTRGLNGWIFGNLLVGGIIGFAVDCVTGSVNEFNPSNINQSLVKDILVIKTL
mgnify:CR=1 FL=1